MDQPGPGPGPGHPAGQPRRGSPAPGLIILAITLVVMVAGVLVVLFPEQTGVPGLNATPPVIATPADPER